MPEPPLDCTAARPWRQPPPSTRWRRPPKTATTSAPNPVAWACGEAGGEALLPGNPAALEMQQDLALDALQRVVDCLGVVLDQVGDVLVGEPLQVMTEHPRFQGAQQAPQAIVH